MRGDEGQHNLIIPTHIGRPVRGDVGEVVENGTRLAVVCP